MLLRRLLVAVVQVTGGYTCNRFCTFIMLAKIVLMHVCLAGLFYFKHKQLDNVLSCQTSALRMILQVGDAHSTQMPGE